MSVTKLEWFTKNGFNEEGNTYCVIGNSYEIKNLLKENKYIYSPLLNWHSANPIELPEGFSHLAINFKDIYTWDDSMKMAVFLQDYKSKIELKFSEAAGTSNSEYIGSIGERIRSIPAIYLDSRGYNGSYGYTYVHSFKIDENILTWFTTKELTDLEKNTKILLTGTIKQHSLYKGVKTTQLSRCVVTV